MTKTGGGGAGGRGAMEQHISTEDCSLEVYGYRRRGWRVWLTHVLTVVLVGLPALVFHWYPTWRLYLTSVRCRLQRAQIVLVVETYQKKCKSYYIHRIKTKVIAGDSGCGEENPAYEEDCEGAGGGDKPPPATSSPPHTAPLQFDDGTVEDVTSFQYFRHKQCLLAWQQSRGRFAQASGVESGRSCAELRARGGRPPTSHMRAAMLNIFGLNEIAVPVRSVGALIALEIFNPFYIFQMFTICVWLAENYYYYCIAVVLMSTFGVATSVVQTRRNQRQLRATVESHDMVTLGESPAREVDSRQVVPGDVVLLPAGGCVLHFDAVLLNGTCIVNESMLTGESVPVTKTALPNELCTYCPSTHAAHTLYCGTAVVQTRYFANTPVRALVIRTGYNTSKGQLVRSILYPVPADFKFDRDTYKFIAILAFIATLGLVYTIVLKAAREITISDIIIKALDIITIVIPPALPAAMTVGRLYAVSRLQRARVYCLNTRAINVSGSIDCVCFDKTGTLTEDGLDMWGVIRSSGSALTAPEDPRDLPDLAEAKMCMAACHGLKIIEGKLQGDPLDLKMFESTGWVLEEPDLPDTGKYDLMVPTVVKPAKPTLVDIDGQQMPFELGVIQQQQFVSALQRSSVVARLLGENVLRVFCKGSPEVVASLCLPHTVPHDMESVLATHAARGYRVLALASRVLGAGVRELQRLRRDQLETELEFRGLVVLENRLKRATPAVIRQLRDANIHVVMITGDNIHTATSVARECGLVRPDERLVTLHAHAADKDRPPAIHAVSEPGQTVGSSVLSLSQSDSGLYSDWAASGSTGPASPAPAAPASPHRLEDASEVKYKTAMSGDTWAALRAHYPERVARLVARGAVFARMSADQKQQLIVEYQALGYYVAMCGDGANDCGALRTAHTGISLSELESSVAASFTAKDPDVSCVSRVLTEGRAALVTSFGVFKFMVAYSLTEFLSVALLYYFDSNLTDFQFLFIDVALILNLAFSFGKTEASRGPLHPRPPLSSLLGWSPLASLLGQLCLVGAAQLLALYLLCLFPWYRRHEAASATDYACWENYAIFAVSMFQYIILAFVFSHGAPYRRSVVTNLPMVASALAVTAVCLYIAISPAKWLAEFLELKMPEDVTLTYLILAVVGGFMILSLLYERFVVEFLIEARDCVPRCLKERRVRKTPHRALARGFSNSDYLLAAATDCSVEVRNENTHSTPM